MRGTLTPQNYDKGFLIDDEMIAGVTSMEGGLYAVYINRYLTGETLAYEEFSSLKASLDYLGAIDRDWAFEAVGCTSVKKKSGFEANRCCDNNRGCNLK